MTAEIEYRFNAGSKPVPLTIEGEWTDSGFEDVAITMDGHDIRDLIRPEVEAAILAQADEAAVKRLADERTEHIVESDMERAHA